MRRSLLAVLLAVVLLAAAPAQAQLRADRPAGPAPVAVYASSGPSLGLAQLLASDAFRVSHSYELSYTSFAGEGLGLGVFTTSLRYQPSDRLAARVDIGVAHSPFGSSALQQQLGFRQDAPAHVYLRNATLAYRPSENALITLSFQQSPFGTYVGPHAFGMMPFGYGGSAFRAQIAPADHEALFWRTPR